jgi:hypothetical protein
LEKLEFIQIFGIRGRIRSDFPVSLPFFLEENGIGNLMEIIIEFMNFSHSAVNGRGALPI